MHRWILLLLILSPLRLFAASTLEVTDLLSSPQSREAVRKSLARSLRGTEVVLQPVDPVLIQSVQWAIPDPSRAACETQVLPAKLAADRPNAKAPEKKPLTQSGPAPDRALAALLDQARESILRQEIQPGMEMLKTARQGLPCSPGLLPKFQVRALFLHEAIGHFFLKDGEDEELFINAVAVDPDTKFDVGGYPSKVRKAWQKAETQLAKRWQVQLDQDLSGVEVYMDGQLLEPSQMVFPGKHVLQAKGPGETLRTTFVIIPPRGPVKVSDMTNFGLFSSEKVRDVLVADLRASRLDEYEVKGLEAWLKRRNRDSVVFAVEPTQESASYFRVFVATRGLVDMQTYLKQSYRVIDKSEARGLKTGPEVGAAFASQWLLGAPSTFTFNERYLGAAVRFDLPLGPVLLGARASIYPYRIRPVTSSGVCGGEGQADCLAAGTSLGLGLGVGYPIYFTKRLRLVPGLYAEGAYLPELLLPNADGSNGGLELIDLLTVGPMGRVALTFGALQAGVRVDVGLELAGGFLPAKKADGTRIDAYPLSATVGAGVVF